METMRKQQTTRRPAQAQVWSSCAYRDHRPTGTSSFVTIQNPELGTT